MKWLLFITLCLLLNGCVTTPMESLPAANTILVQSQRLVKQERWEEATQLLSKGIERYPENTSMKQYLSEVSERWSDKKKRLYDWIRIYETEALLLQRPLLVTITQSAPGERAAKTQLRQLDYLLRSKHPLLIDCAQHQLLKNLRLAKRCIVAANAIDKTSVTLDLLAQIEKAQTQIKQQKKHLQVREIAEERETRLQQAKSYLGENRYLEAIKILEPLQSEAQTDAEIDRLMDTATSGLNLQVMQLLSRGDQLYKEERITEAISVWEQAALLNPASTEIIQRLERAKKVQEKLEKIRINEQGGN